MVSQKLNDNDIEELEFMIPEVEKMYQIKFEPNELSSITSFDDLCDAIIAKINLPNVESCTSQQVFYKLRKSFENLGLLDKATLQTSSELQSIFPRSQRKMRIKKVENDLKIKLNILKAPSLISNSLVTIAIVSFVLLFIYWQIGALGLGFSILGFRLCVIFGNELEVITVQELVEKIVRENYLAIRSEQNTVNKKELKNILLNWFARNLGIDKEKLENATFT